MNTGRYLVVGAPLDDVKGTDAGAVYVFDADSRRLVRKIYGYQASAGARFGSSIAVSGSTLVVGSPGKQGGQGEMSWHRFPAGTAVGIFPGWVINGRSFGATLAMSGSMVAVGAPETEVKYTPEGEPEQTLAGAGVVVVLDLRTPFTRREYSAVEPEAGAQLGKSLACEGTRVLAGAPHASGAGGAGQGAVYLFDFALPGSTTEIIKIQAPDGLAGDGFGSSLAFNTELAFIGAPLAASAAGAVYPVSLSNFSLGTPLQGLQPGDRFGAGLSLNRSRLAIGAPGVSNLSAGAGAAWYFANAADLSTSVMVTASEPQENEAFGSGVSLAGESLVASAPTHTSFNLARGAVHWLPGFSLTLELSPIYIKGDVAPEVPGARLQKAISAQWSATGSPIVLAPMLSPRGKGVWSFDWVSPSLLHSTGNPLGSGPEMISDLLEHRANSPRYGISRVLLKGTGVKASNRHALLFGNEALVRTGSPLPGVADESVKTIGPILQSLAHGQAQLKLNANRVLGTNARNDSLLWLHRPAVGDWVASQLTIREGITATTGQVPETLGEILPHTAISQANEDAEPNYAFFAGLGTQAATNQAFFLNGTDSPTLRKGDPAPGGGTYLSFLGISLQADQYLVRATLKTGDGISTRTNEGLWSNRNGNNELILRKGTAVDGLPEGVSVRKFLAYALTETGIVVARCQMGGRGINSKNDMVLLMVAADGKVTVLEAESNGLSDASGGRINVMQRLDVAADGSYQLQASLSGAPAASNQALLQGKANSDALRPKVLIRKNDFIAGLPGRIRSITITPASRPTGALGGGLPTSLVPGAEGPISLVSLQFLDKTEVLYQHGAPPLLPELE